MVERACGLRRIQRGAIKLGEHDMHAEKKLVIEAGTAFDREMLAASTLYSSTEPCDMCAGYIRRAGISLVFYGTSTRTMRIARGGDPGPMRDRAFYRSIDLGVDWVGPVADEEGAAIHREWWSRLHGDGDGDGEE